MSQETKRGRRHTFAQGEAQRSYDHEVLDIARVVRVVRGGRRFRFRVSVIVGDRAGRVGFGIGKSKDIQHAIGKAQDHGAKHMVSVPMKAGTIPRTVEAKFKGARIMLKPARPGTGIIAGATIRKIADLAGMKDLVSKAHGSSNPMSNALATLKALASLKR